MEDNYANVQKLIELRRRLRGDLELLELSGGATVIEDFWKTIQQIEELWKIIN